MSAEMERLLAGRAAARAQETAEDVVTEIKAGNHENAQRLINEAYRHLGDAGKSLIRLAELER